MRAFVATFLFIQLLRAVVHIAKLSSTDYPRVIRFSRREDAASIFLELAIATWAAFLLWGA